jgi:putative ABC transport system permease protein
LHAQYPEYYQAAAGFGTTAVPLTDELVQNARTRLLVLLGITGFLFLIVCANVANLTLARLMRRQREMAIRAALGAGRPRLFRQLLAEGMLLAILGGALALLLAYAGLGLLVSFVGRFTTRAAEIHIDTNVLLFTLAASLLTGLVLGLLPTLPSRASLTEELADGSAATTVNARQLRARSVLIASQVAVSFVVLVAAGLLTRSFIKLQQVDPGFDTENVLTVRLPLDWSNYRERARSGDFALRLLERAQALPGALSATVANRYPLSGQGPSTWGIQFQGQPLLEEPFRPQIDVQAVSPGYFRTMGIPLVRGRMFADQQADTSAREVVINEALASRYFPQEDPIGRHVCDSDECEDWITIVGVVANAKTYGLGSDVAEEMYGSFVDYGYRDFRLIVRTSGDPLAMAERIESLVRELDPKVPVIDVQTLAQARSESVAGPRLTMMLMALFAIIALAVTATGIGGIIAYTVNSRRRELGIRMAMGAEAVAVVGMVMRQALFLVLTGLAFGVPAAFVLSRSLNGFLFQTAAHDPITFLAVAALLILVAAGASLVPAKRAVSIDPMLTLKTE